MLKKIKNKLSSDLHFKELLSGSTVSFLLKITGMMIGYISILYITNFFGAKAFGTLTLSMTIISIFSIIPKFGMENALVRVVGELFTQKYYLEIGHVLKIVFIFTGLISFIFIFLLYFSSNYIANDILEKSNLSMSLQIISITIFSTTIITIIAATFQGLKKTKHFIFIQTILNQLIFLLMLFLNIFFEWSDSLILIYSYSNVMAAMLATIFLIRSLKFDNSMVREGQHKYNLSDVIKTASPMLFAGSFIMLMSWTDIIMLGIYKSEVDVGIYSAAQKLSMLTSLSLIAVNAIAAPKFVEFYVKKDIKGLEKIARQSTALIFFTSFPLLLIYLLFPGFIMGWFGEEFVLGVTVLMILSVGQFVNAMSGSVGYIMQMTDHQKIFQNVTIISACINVVLNYGLIPSYGINGAAIASMMSMIFWNVILLIYVKKKLGFWTVYLPQLK